MSKRAVFSAFIIVGYVVYWLLFLSGSRESADSVMLIIIAIYLEQIISIIEEEKQ